MSHVVRRARLLAVTVLLLVSTIPAPTAAQEPSLYDRLGGLPAIEAVVAQFVTNVGADERINRFFAGTDLDRLQTLLVEQICQGSGGPCEYTGRSMSDAHRGMGVSGGDFTALVEDLVAALDAFSVPAGEQGELLALLGPMQADIVESRPAPTPVPTAVTQQLPAPTQAPTPVTAPAPTAPTVPESRPPTTTTVTIRGFAFSPVTTTIGVGSIITWANMDQVGHTATGPGFDTGVLGTNRSGSATFSAAGTFSYGCSIHPIMRATIVVQ